MLPFCDQFDYYVFVFLQYSHSQQPIYLVYLFVPQICHQSQQHNLKTKIDHLTHQKYRDAIVELRKYTNNSYSEMVVYQIHKNITYFGMI